MVTLQTNLLTNDKLFIPAFRDMFVLLLNEMEYLK